MAILELSSNDEFIFKNQTSDASSDGFRSDGNKKVLHIFGNLGGGAITLQGTSTGNESDFSSVRKDDGSEVSYTATGVYLIDIYPKGFAYRATLSGSTGADVSIRVI